MRYAIALLLAASLTAVPASGQGTNQANAAANEVAAPANAQQPVLPVTNDMAVAPAPAPNYAPAPARRRGFPWGILGLIGLIGLLGRARS